MFRAATETVKIASRRIVLSNKKTGAGVGAGPGARRDEAMRREERRRCSAARTCELTGVHPRYPAGWFSFCGQAARRPAPFFVCLHLHRRYTYAGRTHYFSSVPLSVQTSPFIFNPSVATELSACLI